MTDYEKFTKLLNGLSVTFTEHDKFFNHDSSRNEEARLIRVESNINKTRVKECISSLEIVFDKDGNFRFFEPW